MDYEQMSYEEKHELHNRPGAGERGAEARADGFGAFEASRITDPGQPRRGDIRISRADPRILISDLMMDLIRNGHADGCALDGDLLSFTAVNGTWTYRLGEHLDDRHARIAELADFEEAER